MCDLCEKPGGQRPEVSTNRRLKLWELRSHFHCAILGTCLSMDELRKVMRQSGVQLDVQASDYDLHATMVGLAEEKNRASRNLHKMLDRKYKRWINAIGRCRDALVLRRHWIDAMDSGDIPGTFWAIMTHPYADVELVKQAFQDVHMLSHLQGASNRSDIKRLKQMELEVAELQETLSKTRQTHNEQITRRDQLIRQQEHELAALTTSLHNSESSPGNDASDQQQDKQKQTLSRRIEYAESQLAQRDVEIAQLHEEIAGLREMLDESREEHVAMEQTLDMLLAEKNREQDSSLGNIDLRGKRILYVGGRSRMAPHLRSLVEAHNGQFNHHDGGLEDSRYGLQCTLAGADMVFCPIDCISHDACKRVKRHCQQQDKQFIPLRSSGLSAFAAGLRRYSQPADNNAHEKPALQ
ncbi:MAG: DUF2325 domain-containing protein [Chromatiales bacterium]|jgi:hypothetical protein